MASDADKPENKLRLAAMNALARREHGREELAAKLEGKFPDHRPQVTAVLARLEGEGLLSDSRFAEAYTRSRISRGQGRLRIANDLKRKGVDEAVIDTALAEADMDWPGLAVEVLIKRFGSTPAADRREKARRMRFLQQRGFNGDEIRHALDAVLHTES